MVTTEGCVLSGSSARWRKICIRQSLLGYDLEFELQAVVGEADVGGQDGVGGFVVEVVAICG